MRDLGSRVLVLSVQHGRGKGSGVAVVGHTTIAITLDTYSHAIPAMQEDAAAKIAALPGG
jgi:hypothetical protein